MRIAPLSERYIVTDLIAGLLKLHEECREIIAPLLPKDDELVRTGSCHRCNEAGISPASPPLELLGCLLMRQCELADLTRDTGQVPLVHADTEVLGDLLDRLLDVRVLVEQLGDTSLDRRLFVRRRTPRILLRLLTLGGDAHQLEYLLDGEIGLLRHLLEAFHGL